MQTEFANRIEAYLLAAKGWVSAGDLCQAFDVSKRDLRAREGRPGLCSHFAISGNKGFRHVVHCTQPEFQHACHRIESHAQAELARIEKLRQRRFAPKKEPLFGLIPRETLQSLLFH